MSDKHIQPQLYEPPAHSLYYFRREYKIENGEQLWRQFIVCGTCGKESPDTTYPQCMLDRQRNIGKRI